MDDPETMSFAAELAKLCYSLMASDQVVATAVVDAESDGDAGGTSLRYFCKTRKILDTKPKYFQFRAVRRHHPLSAAGAVRAGAADGARPLL